MLNPIFAESILEGALYGAIKGAIAGAILGPMVWLVLKAQRHRGKKDDGNPPPAQ